MSSNGQTILGTLDLEFDVAPGRTIPLRRHLSAKGNPWYAVSKQGRKPTPYGVKIPALASTFPAFADVHGVPVSLSPGVTQSGNPKVSGRTTVTIDDQPYTVQVQVSQVDDQTWNLIAKAYPQGGGGGGSQVVELEDL